jgi:hypothetical protein
MINKRNALTKPRKKLMNITIMTNKEEGHQHKKNALITPKDEFLNITITND